MTDALRFAVLGHPVSHSLSPAMHRAALSWLGMPHRYDAIDVPDRAALERVLDDLRAGRLAGANVTMPHKRAALALADDVDPSAASAGAANTLVVREGRVRAHNTDVPGLADDLRAEGLASIDVAFVIGAGGAAAAAVAACRSLGATRVVATSRRWADPAAMARADLPGVEEMAWPGEEGPSPALVEAFAAADVIVQSTSAGMRGADPGEPLAALVPWERLRRDVVVYDLVYDPSVTPIVAAARARGLRAQSGLGMLARQGARSLGLWLGVEPDPSILREGALAELASR